jgi:hypothetical protein
MRFGSSKFQAIVDDKRARRDKLLTSAHKYVESEHGPYIRATGKYFFYIEEYCLNVHQHFFRQASEITQRIGNGEWTASQVVESYIARAAYAHSITNCGTESVSNNYTNSILS